MAILKAISLGIPVGSLLATGTFFYATRQIEAVQLSPSDSIFRSKYHRDYNPNNNPTVHDLHIRRVPISEIDPSLLQNQECLIERYTGGVWAGAGMYSSLYHSHFKIFFFFFNANYIATQDSPSNASSSAGSANNPHANSGVPPNSSNPNITQKQSLPMSSSY